jgi:predicted nucleotidyltransferase component of viral defense system
MKTTDMSIKGKIKNLVKQSAISPQEALQMYLLEHFLLRLSESKHKDNFIFKGGCIIAQLCGQSQRTTRDIDGSIQGIPLNIDILNNVINEIISIKINDEIQFSLLNIANIRNNDIYGGLRATIKAALGNIKENIKIDITAGDIITPKAIIFEYKMMFENRSINIMAYNTETIIAEKFETIISRGILNTRGKDFYEIYTLVKLNKYDKTILKKAVSNTFKHRNAPLDIAEMKNVILELKNNKTIFGIWKKYKNTYKYAQDISFEEIINSIDMIITEIDINTNFTLKF